MSFLKILSVLGTRPEGIKMAPVIKAIECESRMKSIVCVTGQHREMLDSVLSLFGIKADFDLNIMRDGQDLTEITCKVLSALRETIRDCSPDIILVQGDTTTTMAAALAAYYAKRPVGHIEAGLRTDNIYSPWPEEVNRRINTVIANIHFAPTEQSRTNLLREGVPKHNIYVTGNTVIDALLDVVNGIKEDSCFINEMHDQYPFLSEMLETGQAKTIILVTGHRRESFGKGFEDICYALKTLAQRSGIQIVYPVHLNPNVREPVYRILGDQPNVALLDPLDYRSFVYLMYRAKLILTDSGGVQEEAPSLGKPVLVMRDVTERGEAIEIGTVKLVGTNREKIVDETTRLLDYRDEYLKMTKKDNPYGDGKATSRIIKILLARFCSDPK